MRDARVTAATLVIKKDRTVVWLLTAKSKCQVNVRVLSAADLHGLPETIHCVNFVPSLPKYRTYLALQGPVLSIDNVL